MLESQQVHERMVAALASADVETMSDCLAEDVVWDLGGKSQVSGPHVGRQATVDFLLRAVTLTNGTFGLEPIAFAYAPGYAFAWQRITGERDGQRLSETEAIVFEISDGKITAAHHRPELDKLDAFFA